MDDGKELLFHTHYHKYASEHFIHDNLLSAVSISLFVLKRQIMLLTCQKVKLIFTRTYKQSIWVMT